MFHSLASRLITLRFLLAAIWLGLPFNVFTAHGDGNCDKQADPFGTSARMCDNNYFRWTEIRDNSSLRSLKSELQYRNHLNSSHARTDGFGTADGRNDGAETNLLTVFKLAMEEFDLLSGVRVYWNYTERKIEKLALKLRLKGEITVDPHAQADTQTLASATAFKPKRASNRFRKPSLRTFLTPTQLNWNIGLNPDDMSLYGDLRINSHLSFSGDFGNENRVGIYFRYEF